MAKNKTSIVTFLLDFYLDFSLACDIVFASLIFIVPHRFICVKILTEENFLDLLSNLVSTCVSLAGFMITALTVVVTFKSSIVAKGLQDATNALELIVSSKLYPKIVNVYTGAILEFLLLTIILYFVWIFFKNIDSDIFRLKTVTAAVLCTGLAFGRSLYILVKVLKAEQTSKG
jgi:hypothetical protein